MSAMDEMLENSAGKELIDATQEAVIGAVSDVGNIIKTTTEEISNGHHEVFYQSAEFWVGVAFVAVLCFLYKPIKKILSALLQKRIDGVVAQIKEAEQLRDEARNFLADYEQKIDGMQSKADKIIKKAQKDARDFKSEELKKLENDLATQERYTSTVIKSYEQKMINESSMMVVNKAMRALKIVIADGLSAKDQKSLIDKSIEAISELK